MSQIVPHELALRHWMRATDEAQKVRTYPDLGPPDAAGCQRARRQPCAYYIHTMMALRWSRFIDWNRALA